MRNCLFLFAYVNLLGNGRADTVRFTVEPASVVTGPEEPAPLVCAVKGRNYRISWKDHKGKPLEDSRYKKVTTQANWQYNDVVGSNIFVTIWSKQKTKFTCVVSDIASGSVVATRDAFLSRDRSLKMEDGSSKQEKGYVGDPILMDCGLERATPKEVYWFKSKDSTEVGSYVYTPEEESARNKLTVFPASKDDTAHYMCYYLNENGELQKGTRVWLGALRERASSPKIVPTSAYSPPIRTIWHKTTTTTTIPTSTSQTTTQNSISRFLLVEITSTFIDVYETVDKKRQLICEATGHPRPTVFWTRLDPSKKLGTQSYHEKDELNVVRSTLKIGALSRAENFTCVARQHQFSKEVTQDLFVQPETLAAPIIKNSPVLDETGKFVRIEWEPVPSVQRYILYVTINNTEPAQPYPIQKEKDFYEFEVKPFTEYSAYLTAEDFYDRKSFGSTTFEFAGPRRPGDPTNLSVVLTDGATSARLSWTPVNVPGVLYDIYFTKGVPPSDLFHWRLVSDVSESFYEFATELQLRPGDKYLFLGKDEFF